MKAEKTTPIGRMTKINRREKNPSEEKKYPGTEENFKHNFSVSGWNTSVFSVLGVTKDKGHRWMKHTKQEIRVSL